jgi:hypothetical protein
LQTIGLLNWECDMGRELVTTASQEWLHANLVGVRAYVHALSTTLGDETARTRLAAALSDMLAPTPFAGGGGIDAYNVGSYAARRVEGNKDADTEAGIVPTVAHVLRVCNLGFDEVCRQVRRSAAAHACGSCAILYGCSRQVGVICAEEGALLRTLWGAQRRAWQLHFDRERERAKMHRVAAQICAAWAPAHATPQGLTDAACVQTKATLSSCGTTPPTCAKRFV